MVPQVDISQGAVQQQSSSLSMICRVAARECIGGKYVEGNKGVRTLGCENCVGNGNSEYGGGGSMDSDPSFTIYSEAVLSDQGFRKKTEASIKVHGWLNSIFEPAKFNKKRYVGQYSDTNSKAPPVQEFSFSANEQGAFVKTFYALIEVELYTFLYNNAGIILFKTVEAFAKRQRPKIKPDFENADTLCMINFFIENIEIFTKKYENPLELFKDYKKSVRNKWRMELQVKMVGGTIENFKTSCGNYEDVYMKRKKLKKEIARRFMNKEVPPKRKFQEIAMSTESESTNKRNKPHQGINHFRFVKIL
ncbi:830_t:CDS:2 [Funneliformis geosporum]|nr:830_t:CDS:2 [Funneliformis geosporum]